MINEATIKTIIDHFFVILKRIIPLPVPFTLSSEASKITKLREQKT